MDSYYPGAHWRHRQELNRRGDRNAQCVFLMFKSLRAVRSKRWEFVILGYLVLPTMKWNVSAVAVMLPASRAFGSTEHVANAVNVISGITGEEEYCLRVSTNGFTGRKREGQFGRAAGGSSLTAFANLSWWRALTTCFIAAAIL